MDIEVVEASMGFIPTNTANSAEWAINTHVTWAKQWNAQFNKLFCGCFEFLFGCVYKIVEKIGQQLRKLYPTNEFHTHSKLYTPF